MFLELGAEQIACKWPELFVAIFHHRNTAGQPMSFINRPWLSTIYKDKSPYQIFMKAVQCGLSERTIIEALTSAREGRSVLYILPTLEVRNDFVNNRIDKMIEQVPFYRDMMHGADNTGLKHFGKGTIKFVGSNVLMSFKEFPADVIIIDELDQCNQSNIIYATDRISGVSFRGYEPIIRKISNPSVSGYGIHKEYSELSDKREWFVKCAHCNEWQNLDWFVNVVRQTGDQTFSISNSTEGQWNGEPALVCRSCGKLLEGNMPGEWVAEFPDRTVVGYHISKLITDQTSLSELYHKFIASLNNPTEKQHFINSELGLPYTGEGDKLSFADFMRCTIDGYHLPLRGCDDDGNQLITIAGVDVGLILHVRIDALMNGKRRMLYAGSVPDFGELKSLLTRYGVRIYVIDEKPEMHKAREFIHSYPGGFLCSYTEPRSVSPFKVDPKTQQIKVNRTESLDEATSMYVSAKIELPVDWQYIDNGEWLKQMTAPTRIIDIKQTPPVYIWDEAGQADHHRHADNYCQMAAKILGFGINNRAEMIWI